MASFRIAVLAPTSIDRRALQRVLSGEDFEIISSVSSTWEVFELLSEKARGVDLVVAVHAHKELGAPSVWHVVLSCREAGLETPFVVLDVAGDATSHPGAITASNVTVLTGIPPVPALVRAIERSVTDRWFLEAARDLGEPQEAAA